MAKFSGHQTDPVCKDKQEARNPMTEAPEEDPPVTHYHWDQFRHCSRLIGCTQVHRMGTCSGTLPAQLDPLLRRSLRPRRAGHQTAVGHSGTKTIQYSLG